MEGIHMKFKRILCAALCAVLLLGALAIPAGAKACACGEVVQVYVDGFAGALYYNYGTPEQEEAGMARTDDLPAGIWQLLRGVGLGVWRRSWEPVAGGLGALMFSIMGHLAMDANGESIAPITSRWRLDPEQDHLERPEYRFHYDFRIDPFVAAAQLNEFIEAVLKATGHGKIALTGNSEGAVICMTYLKQYGAKRLDSFILVCGAWQGLSLVGELMTNQFGLSAATVTGYIGNNDDGSGNLKRAMALLEKSGLLNFLEPLGEFVLDTMGEQIYDEILLPLFGSMPIIWAFVPGEYYAEARQLLAGKPELKQLLAKADKYQYEVQAKAGKLLKDAKSKGVKVAVVASYGQYPMPLTKNSTFQSDSLIDTAYESGGATTAPIGETLPPSKSKYRSPDGIIDAATCILPDNTWFIKDCGHEAGPSKQLRQWVIHSKKQPTVWDSPDWPQWLVKNGEGRAQAYTG